MVGTTLKVPHYLFSQYVANYLYYVTVIQPYFVVHEMIMSPDVIVLIESNKSAHATVKLSTYTQLLLICVPNCCNRYLISNDARVIDINMH